MKQLSSLAVIFNLWKYQNCDSHHVMNRKLKDKVLYFKCGIYVIFSLVHCTNENIRRFRLSSKLNKFHILRQNVEYPLYITNVTYKLWKYQRVQQDYIFIFSLLIHANENRKNSYLTHEKHVFAIQLSTLRISSNL